MAPDRLLGGGFRLGKLRYVEGLNGLATDPALRGGPHHNHARPGTKPADLTKKEKPGSPGVGIIRTDFRHIWPKPPILGRPQRFPVEQHLHRSHRCKTNDPTDDPQDTVAADRYLVDVELHRRSTE